MRLRDIQRQQVDVTILIAREISHAIRPFNPGKMEFYVEGMPESGWAFGVYIERFGYHRFDLKVKDELATAYPAVFNHQVAQQFGEAVSEYYRGLDIPVDDHIVLGED